MILCRNLVPSLLIGFVTVLVFGLPGASQAAEPATVEPVASWDFETPLQDRSVGSVTIVDDGPSAPEFPDFGAVNSALRLTDGGSLRVPDHPDGRFDFGNGDEITLEAWVDLTKINPNMYVIGKGRTQRPGFARDNQNWALRLRSQGGSACVNFLFRSRSDESVPNRSSDKVASDAEQWHRWTSHQGFVAGSGWHHIAVTYQFGKPDSIRGYLDGRQVKGRWDMDGPTNRPPVNDDDEVWIGSSMGANPASSIDGMLDQVAVYRSIVPAEILKQRFHYQPQPVAPLEVPPRKVVVQLFGPVGSITEIPRRIPRLLTQWNQHEMALVRLPHQYDDWGIRQDWGSTLLVRATADIRLPEGRNRILVRSRGLSRLWIDDQIVLTTPPQKNRSSAHNLVDPLPNVPISGMRPHAMNDNEVIVDFDSGGDHHRFVLESIVGGPSFRLEFGEHCVAVQPPNKSMFFLLGAFPLGALPLGADRQFPLTDEGWTAFVQKQATKLDLWDANQRRVASQKSIEYWNRRHQYARDQLLVQRPEDSDSSIDQLLEAKRNQAVEVSADQSRPNDQTVFFTERVQPILNQHCSRCHGEKQRGDLSLRDRNNLLAGGESGEPAVVPGEPEKSYLFGLVSAAIDDYRMPPSGDGLTIAEQETIRRWIADGALMPKRVDHEIAQPTEIIDDHAFLRRAYLDTVGVAPTLDEIEQFFADSRSDRRHHLIDRLLSDSRVADNWVGYWQDALAENPNLLKPMLNNTGPFRWWIHEALQDNKPLDRFATELIMMRGSRWNGGTAGFGIASQNDAPMAAKAMVIGSSFLGVQMKCARCHDAPYHRWKQSDLFHLAAMLDRKPIKVPATSTVPLAFFENRARQPLIEATIRPGDSIAARWPLADLAPEIPDRLMNNANDSRERLAARVTLSRRFAASMANRIWGRLMGLALVEPVDDWDGNPPSDPRLMDYLADQLIGMGYDWRGLCRMIMNSNAYQRRAIDRREGMDPIRRLYSGPYRRRMSAEQVVDSVAAAVGRRLDIEPLTLDIDGTLPAKNFLNFGVPRRAWELTTLGNERDRPSLALPRAQAIADVMKAFGWRNSRPEPITRRQDQANLIQPAILANGTFGNWSTRLTDDSSITHLALVDQPLTDLITNLYLAILTRPPTDHESKRFEQLLADGYEDRWVPLDDVKPREPQQRFRYVSWSNHLNTEANKIKQEMEQVVRCGPAPTRYLQDDWRARAEDALWALLNSPEMVLIP